MRVAIALLLLISGFSDSTLQAEIVFLEPTPYLSRTDSPFDFSGLGETFFFENFEDGEINFPIGVTTVGLRVRPPGPLTDSVDGDDGAIDGSGRNGHSCESSLVTVSPTIPLQYDTTMLLRFGSNGIGLLPTRFGFAWTDAMEGSFLSLVVRDNLGNSFRHDYGSLFGPSLMDASYDGGSREDIFIALTTSVGIREVFIGTTKRSDNYVFESEIDHIQFGIIVPESFQSETAALACLMLLLHRMIMGSDLVFCFWRG